MSCVLSGNPSRGEWFSERVALLVERIRGFNEGAHGEETLDSAAQGLTVNLVDRVEEVKGAALWRHGHMSGACFGAVESGGAQEGRW